MNWGGGIKSLYFEVSTAYSGYSDICDLVLNGIDSGNYSVIMSTKKLDEITASNDYLAVFTLKDSVVTKIKNGSYAYLRVSNGMLQAHQELSSNPYKYYYYINSIDY